MSEPSPPISPPPAGPLPNPTPDLLANSDERTLALLAHLLGIFSGFIGALIIWLVKKDSSPFVSDQAKEALNFQITLIIGYFISGVLVCVGVGLLLLMVIWVLNIVFCIVACVAASNGERYRYPMTIRLIQ